MDFKEYLKEDSMDIRNIMKLFGITQKKMLQHQTEYKKHKWSIYGGLNSDNTFVSDYNDLTEKGKVFATIGLVNGYLQKDGKKLTLTRKAMK